MTLNGCGPQGTVAAAARRLANALPRRAKSENRMRKVGFACGPSWAAAFLPRQRSQIHGRRTSALAAYLRASNYFRAAYTFLIGAPLDPRVIDAYRRQRAAFESAVGLMRPTAERITVPCLDAAFHGYLFRAADGDRARPTLIITGGYDSTAEEAYFFSGAAAVAPAIPASSSTDRARVRRSSRMGWCFARIGKPSLVRWSILP